MKKFLPLLPAALFYGLIFFLSSRPLRLDIPLPQADKLAHGAAYALPGFLLAFGFNRFLRSPLRIRMAVAILAGVGLGILDEVHQNFVPGRMPDLLDIVADIAGVALGFFLFQSALRKKRPEKSR